jgi:hypothetical protein
MSLAEALLPKLADWRPAGEGRQSVRIALPDQGWTVGLTADRADSVGCRLTRIEADRTARLANDDTALDAHARRAAGRVTGLLEPLRLVEVDRGQHVALLRSDAPAAKGESVQYYEVKFTGRNLVTVERFKASKVGPAGRESVPFSLTHEVLAKLVDDLVRD